MTMRPVYQILLLLLVACLNECWSDETPSQCEGDSHGVGPLSKGERKRIENQCAEVYCREDGNIELHRCHQVIIEPPCYETPGNLSKPYPDCCFEVACLETYTPTPPRNRKN